jgi:hypothetical protein
VNCVDLGSCFDAQQDRAALRMEFASLGIMNRGIEHGFDPEGSEHPRPTQELGKSLSGIICERPRKSGPD